MLRNTLKPEETNSTGNRVLITREKKTACVRYEVAAWADWVDLCHWRALKQAEIHTGKKKLLTNMHVKIFYNEVEISEIIIVASVSGQLLPSYNFFFFSSGFIYDSYFPNKPYVAAEGL